MQATRSNLWDRETVLTYKKEANRWKMRTVSMGGGRKLIEEKHLLDKHPPSPVPDRVMSIEWTKALPIVKAGGFEGWFAFETPHAGPEAWVEETKKNIAFVMKCLS